MCTAASYHSDGFYFGRTLDNDCFYGESVAFVPRNYIFNMKHIPDTGRHYAIIGTALSDAEYPLFYDAMNEKGLCMAGLNFVKSTVYGEYREGAVNVAPYEFIPYILGNCDSVSQAKKLLAETDKQIVLIAELVGYNGKTSFYLSFKRNVGITPNEYRRRAEDATE